MMRRQVVWAAMGGLILVASNASAQYRPGGYPGGFPGGYPGAGSRPTTSPYLNLLGRGNPATNYYGIVRPQQMLNNAMFGGVGAMGPSFQPTDSNDPEAQRATGHGVTFNYLGHYYNSHPAMANMGGGQGNAGRFNSIGGGTQGSFGAGPMNAPMNRGGMSRGGMSVGGFGGMRR